MVARKRWVTENTEKPSPNGSEFGRTVRSWISVISGVRFSSQISHLLQRPDFDLARSWHGVGQRFTQATASSMSLTSQSQKPATNPRVSVKGPSMTVRLGPSNTIRLPCEEALRPSAASKMPLFKPASPAWHRNDERRYWKSTSFRKFFSAVEAQPPLSGWAHDHRDVGKLREQPTSVAHRPPIVEKNLQWAPHRYPAENKEAFAGNLRNGAVPKCKNKLA